MTQDNNEKSGRWDGLDEAAVADFLRENPEFFLRQRDLLGELRIPHNVAPAVSLIEHQVDALRKEKRRLRWRLDDLLRVARENDRVAELLHRLTLELLDSPGLDATLVTLRDGLRADFRADIVNLVLIGETLPQANVAVLAPGHRDVARMSEHFRGNRPVVGRLSREQMRLAFGEHADDVQSAAVIPLDDTATRGLVAIGSRDPERYRGDQGTVFLTRLGDLVARTIRRALADG